MDPRTTAAARHAAEIAAAPPEVLSGLLAAEYPQTTAFVMLLLPRAVSARVLARLPESYMREVARRMAVAAEPRPEVAARVLGVLASLLRQGPSPLGEDGRRDRMDGIADAVAAEDVGVGGAFRKAFGSAFPKGGGAGGDFDVEALIRDAVADVGTRFNRILGGVMSDAAEALGRAAGQAAAGPPAVDPIDGIENVFRAMCGSWERALVGIAGPRASVELDNLSSVRLGDYFGSVPLPAMQAVFAAPQWGGQGVAVCDSALIYSMADVLLGGERSAPCLRIEGRPYAAGEHAVMGLVVEGALAALGDACAPWGADFRLERIETDPRRACVADRAAPCLVARFRVDLEDRGGRMDILLPYEALATVRGAVEGMSVPWLRAKAALDVVVERARVDGGDAERLGAEVRAFVSRMERTGLLRRG